MTDLPFDNSYATLPDIFYAHNEPSHVPQPTLIKVNDDLAGQLGIPTSFLQSAEAIGMFSGNQLPTNATPIAMAYAGHQFGGWAPQLGDGRALLIGELIDKNGLRHDIQLKGSGRTAFSRGGDGKAGIGPVLREYIVSEAMAALGIPTTRALAAVSTGEMIMRQGAIPGAVLTRVAQSHVRVGTFQYFAAMDYADPGKNYVKTLADYVIDRHYPEAKSIANETAGNKYQQLLRAVVKRQAHLIAQWMGLGFIHGVMNTDNMQVVGETIDYGPCAFMDVFHPNKKFSSIDRQGRYAWNNQANIGQWNISRLAEALLPLLDESETTAIELAEIITAEFFPIFHKRFLEIFAQKIGLNSTDTTDELMQSTFIAMAKNEVDFTLFFRHLTLVAGGAEAAELLTLFQNPDEAKAWLESWNDLFTAEPSSTKTRVLGMQQINPIYIPRNHRVEEAIQGGLANDFELFHKLVDVLSKPFEAREDYTDYELAPLPEEEVRRTFCGT